MANPYNFVDVNVPAPLSNSSEPVDNMSINGTPLNQLVEGYRHLNVSGRGLLEREIKTTSISGRRGVWIDEQTDKEREITIEYQIDAKTSEELRARFMKLNKVLRTYAPSGFLEVSFKDEPDFTYYAYFQDGDDFKEDRYSIVSEFTLLVPDGYKKRKPQSSTGKISLEYANQVLPEQIIVTPTKLTDLVQITNRGKTIEFRGSYAAGKDITINFGYDEITANYDNRSVLSELSLYSHVEDFFISNGDTVTAKNATVKKVTWRDEAQ